MILYLCLLLLQVWHAVANTEKTIFLGPRSSEIPSQHPTLEDLQLEALSPRQWSLRTHLKAEFASSDSEYGPASWLLLHGLREGQRYEVRICWAATQPTSFRLDTYELQTVFETPKLITSLANYADSRQLKDDSLEALESAAVSELTNSKPGYAGVDSVLLLQIFSAADYYTANKTLMEHVPPVYVDIILDPFLFNVFPRSLVPTAAYLVIIAIGSWYLSKAVARCFTDMNGEESTDVKKKI
ncbi:hypothetical protein BP5796_04627 [Coleophoma crateriformis]|uniref:Uncharacterized protein n=1 Tax=Coleophoma crateriformis TaxID=565419 RepID=A0A3D8S9W0_9HELO|nr:hypothetical protein BP5796_04627 [Coleophoma crateriformis]